MNLLVYPYPSWKDLTFTVTSFPSLVTLSRIIVAIQGIYIVQLILIYDLSMRFMRVQIIIIL
jgi:hypothetical protein